MIPSGRPAHDIGYDGLDQENAYLPPDLIDIADPVTTYRYNKDRQLTLITRPDGATITPVYDPVTGKQTGLITPQGTTNYEYYQKTGQLNSTA